VPYGGELSKQNSPSYGAVQNDTDNQLVLLTVNGRKGHSLPVR